MSLKMILTHCCNYIIKHLEKSKCFFRAQKGEAYVHLGMGAYSTRLVSILVNILDGGSVLLIARKKSN